MTRRKYEMRHRADAVRETRRRILEATSACHRELGINATSVDDVARRAGVAVGTVYRHFPTLEDLVGACGAIFLDRFSLPTPNEAPGVFRGARGRRGRLDRLVDEIAARYERGAAGWVRVREAQEDFNATAEAHRRFEASLDALVSEAVRPLRWSSDRRRVLRGLVDPRVWQSLAQTGLQPDDIERHLRRLVHAV
jgi:AcrR family transcriptional regulator